MAYESSRCVAGLARYKASLIVALSAAIALTAVSFIVGTIAVENGAGWDGSIYLKHIKTLGHGGGIVGDNYHAIRMGSFIPAILAARVGLTPDAIILFSVLVNIVTMSLALGLFYDFLRMLSTDNLVALISTATLLFSWSFLIMPVYYPILTDHLAQAIVCMGLWLWARGGRAGLYFLCLWTPWVMPPLALVPWVLAAIPRQTLVHTNNSGLLSNFGINCRVTKIAVFLLLGVPSLIGALMYINQFSDGDIIAHTGQEGFALSELRTWSTVATCLSIMAVAWVWAHLLTSINLFKSIQISSLVIATLCVSLSFLIMGLWLDWDKGLGGPPLVQYMFLQSLSAPFKPLIAHVLYFGPVVLLALCTYLLKSHKRTAVPWPLTVLFAGFLPALALSSESRLWVLILPVIVAVVALTELPFRLRVACFMAGVALCIPSFGLADFVNQAVANHEDFASPNWQHYFGRLGPWMSTATYKISIAFTGLFIIFSLLMIIYKPRGASCK